MAVQAEAETQPGPTELGPSTSRPASNSRSKATRVAATQQTTRPPVSNGHDETSSSGSSDSDSELGQVVDETSSSGSSDDSDSDSATNINVTATSPSPSSLHNNPVSGEDNNGDIHTRLQTFFSQLAEQRTHGNADANEVIEHFSDSDDADQIQGGESADDGQQYVQLDLALGVLSEEGEQDIEFPSAASETEQDEELQGEGEDEESELLRRLKSVGKQIGDEVKSPKKRKIEEVG